MAVREFDGIDDQIVLDDGTMGAIANGARSYVLLVKPTALTSSACFMSCCNGTGTVDGFFENGNGEFGRGGDSGGDALFQANLSSGAWQVIGFSKAAGTTVIRVHRKVLGSGSWTHANSTATSANVATDVDNIKIASFGDGTGDRDMRLAVASVFATQLADADYVAIESAATTASIAALSPQTLWDFNQDAVGTNVLDLMGTGADQTAITGTTVIADGVDDPAWTFGLTQWVPETDADETDRLVTSTLRLR